LQDEYTDFNNLIEDIEDTVKEIAEEEVFVAIEPFVDALITKHEKLAELRGRYEKLYSEITTLSTLNQTERRTKENAQILEERFHKEMPDICPLCGLDRTLKIKGAELSSIIIRDGRK